MPKQEGGRLHPADKLFREEPDHIISQIKDRDPDQSASDFLDAIGEARAREIAKIPLAEMVERGIVFVAIGDKSALIKDVLIEARRRFQTHLGRRGARRGRARGEPARADEDEGDAQEGQGLYPALGAVGVPIAPDLPLAPSQLKSLPSAMRLKIVNDAEVEKEIREKAEHFRVMSGATKRLKDLARERMGGTVARTELFEAQGKAIADPVIRRMAELVKEIAKGNAMDPKKLEVGTRFKAGLTEQGAVSPNDALFQNIKEFQEILRHSLGQQTPTQPTPTPTRPTPSTTPPASPPRTPTPSPPRTPTPSPPRTPTPEPEPVPLPDYPDDPTPSNLLKYVRSIARPIAENTQLDDTTQLSLSVRKGELQFSNRSVKIPKDGSRLEIDRLGFNIPLNPETAFLFTFKVSNLDIIRIGALVSGFDESNIQLYSDAIGLVVSKAEFRRKNHAKAEVLKTLFDTRLGTNSGAGRRKEPKAQSGRLVRGRLGHWQVDMEQLGKGILSAKDDSGDVVYHSRISNGVKHLLLNKATKHQAGKGVFKEEDLDAYNAIAKQAGVRHKPTDRRRQMSDPATKRAVFLPDDPKKLMDRLQTLLGLHEQGNDNKDVKSEAIAIADRLLKSRHLTKGQHRAIFNDLV